MSITLTKGGESLTIDTPRYGYEVALYMPICQCRLSNNKYIHRDESGTVSDWRICKLTWLAPRDKMESLAQWFRYYSKARGDEFNIVLGSTPTGFFPFGPDKGDVGTFAVRMISVEQGGWLMAPYGYAESTVELLMVSAPGGYSLPAEYDEGTLVVGSVSGLRWPEGGYKPKSILGLRTDLTKTGAAYTIDLEDVADSWESEWLMQCNQGKAAALVNYLSTIGRAGDITITAPDRHYPFGVEQHLTNDEAGVFTARLIMGDDIVSVVNMRHLEFNAWEIGLKWWMKESLQVTGVYDGIYLESDTGIMVDDPSGYVYN